MSEKLTPRTMTQTGAKLVDASRMLWSLYQIMQYCNYQALDVFIDPQTGELPEGWQSPENPNWLKMASLFGYSEDAEGIAKAQMLMSILNNAQEQAHSKLLNGKPNAMMTIMWKVGS